MPSVIIIRESSGSGMWIRRCLLYLSEIQEEAGILPGLGQVGQEDCDTDQEYGRILTHLPQRLQKKREGDERTMVE